MTLQERDQSFLGAATARFIGCSADLCVKIRTGDHETQTEMKNILASKFRLLHERMQVQLATTQGVELCQTLLIRILDNRRKFREFLRATIENHQCVCEEHITEVVDQLCIVHSAFVNKIRDSDREFNEMLIELTVDTDRELAITIRDATRQEAVSKYEAENALMELEIMKQEDTANTRILGTLNSLSIADLQSRIEMLS